MKHLRNVVSACLSAALLSACGGNNFSSSPQMPAAPQLRATGPTYKLLYSFKAGQDGGWPEAGMIPVNGALYGTTTYGGVHGHGTVFKITAAGAESVVYPFKGKLDGEEPDGGLILVNGQLYGTTTAGGRADDGTVFTVNPSTGKERVVFSFKGVDGVAPQGALVALNGTLYGTTTDGGRYRYGTVFAVSTTGTERVLHSFKDYSDGDGAVPEAGLTDVNGALYGTTEYGGASNNGSIFEVSTSGTEEVIYSFADGGDGAHPADSLTALNGTLYGTAEGGYAGSVFEVSTSGALTVLYDFKAAPDGALPEAGVAALKGTLYGTTIHGGSSSYYCLATAGCGTVFSVSASGTETVLYRFKGIKDGAFPEANLTALNGVLYGTTYGGGAKRFGTVFEVTP